ncbi:MAG: bifunctional hydroxymethylpyrimidine kinase/phosphomethylpyrimidine kinase, partial [Nitrososphaerota archaeon]
IQGIEPEVVKAQIKAVVEDIGVDAIKTGMLYTSEIIKVVAEEVRKLASPLVVDPVMMAKSGARLLKEEAVKSLVDELLPLATVITPNALEVEVLVKIKPRDVDDAKKAAKAIADLGPKAVVVKGGHVPTHDKVVDVLYYEGKYEVYEAQRLDEKYTHGTGCSFASAIAAELAKGKSVVEAVASAKRFITKAIRWGIPVGRGIRPVNPMASLYEDAERFEVIEDVKKAVRLLEESPNFYRLIPECQSNVGMALSHAADLHHIAAIPGRIVRLMNRAKASACPEFGASKHVASTILTIMKFDPSVKAALNIKYSDEVLKLCRDLGYKISFYDRREEPEEIKKVEGKTTGWGAEQAVKRLGEVPDIIYHTGDYGKEAMIVLLGKSAQEVAKRALEIADLYSKQTSS